MPLRPFDYCSTPDGSLCLEDIPVRSSQLSLPSLRRNILHVSTTFLQNTKVGRAAAHARRVAVLNQKVVSAKNTRDVQATLLEEAAASNAAVEAKVSLLFGRDSRPQPIWGVPFLMSPLKLVKVDKQQARAVSAIAALDAQVRSNNP